MRVRRQKPVKGGRLPLHPCVLRDIERAVVETARKFRVSKSFVVATALAEAFGVDAESYYEQSPRRLRRVK